MPYMSNGKRDYKKELSWEKRNGKKRQDDRVERNKARRESGLSVGDSRQVDHIKPLSEGGSNSKSNRRVVSAKTNLRKEALRKKRKAN